jgi:hypothetical protein
MEILFFIIQHEVIIVLAIGGAILALVGNVLDLKGLLVGQKTAQAIRKFGYAVSWISVACFILVGFFQ